MILFDGLFVKDVDWTKREYRIAGYGFQYGDRSSGMALQYTRTATVVVFDDLLSMLLLKRERESESDLDHFSVDTLRHHHHPIHRRCRRERKLF